MVGRPFQPGQSGNPGGRPKERAFRNALNAEIEASNGDLRGIARKLIDKAKTGDIAAIRELADRLDGKVAQAIVGDAEHDPIRVRPEITDEDRARAIATLIAKVKRQAK